MKQNFGWRNLQTRSSSKDRRFGRSKKKKRPLADRIRRRLPHLALDTGVSGIEITRDIDPRQAITGAAS